MLWSFRSTVYIYLVWLFWAVYIHSPQTIYSGQVAASCKWLLRGPNSDRLAQRQGEIKLWGKREDEWLIQQWGLKWDVVGLNITKTWVKFVNHTPTFFNCQKCESLFFLIFSLLTYPDSLRVLLVSAFTLRPFLSQYGPLLTGCKSNFRVFHQAPFSTNVPWAMPTSPGTNYLYAVTPE